MAGGAARFGEGRFSAGSRRRIGGGARAIRGCPSIQESVAPSCPSVSSGPDMRIVKTSCASAAKFFSSPFQ